MKKRILSVVCVFALLLGLAGCGSSTYERRTDQSPTLYIGEVGSIFPTSFMPWLSRDGVAPTISSMVYSTLFSYDETTGVYDPLLADTWYYVDKEGNPIVTEDGLVDYDRLEEVYGGDDSKYFPIRFELCKDATWSDGEPVTAEDIWFTFDLAANQKLSNHAGALAWVSDLLHKYDSKTGRLTRQGIYTYDHGANEKGYPISAEEKDTVFYFEVNKVLGAITPLVSTVLVLPQHVYGPIISLDNPLNNTDPDEALKYAYTHPVGCGAYLLDADQTNGQEIVLKKRTDYYRKAADGSDLYKVDQLNFILYQDINVAIYALKKGHLDVLDSSISPNYRKLFESDDDIAVLSAPGTFTQTLVINLNAPKDKMTSMRSLLTDRRVREALALAVDQDSLIKNVLNGSGSTAPAGLILPSLTDLYSPEADILSDDYEQRLVRANSLLDEVCPDRDTEGYRTLEGKRVSFQILGTPGEQEVIEFLRVLFQKIGVEVKFAAKGSTPENTYLYGGNFDMTIQSLVLSLSNVDIMYKSHFTDLSRSSNYGRLSDDLVNSTIESMRTTVNLNTKYEELKKLQLLIAEQFYKLPLYCSDVITVARTDRFSGWVVKDGQGAFSTDSLKALKFEMK